MELGRYLSEIDWSLIQDLVTCEEKSRFFSDIITRGVNFIMPERKVKLHNNDAPWVTGDFKRLIKLRQRAFLSGNTQLFKMYRNDVNSERKRAKYYATKVRSLKNQNPKHGLK